MILAFRRSSKLFLFWHVIYTQLRWVQELVGIPFLCQNYCAPATIIKIASNCAQGYNVSTSFQFKSSTKTAGSNSCNLFSDCIFSTSNCNFPAQCNACPHATTDQKGTVDSPKNVSESTSMITEPRTLIAMQHFLLNLKSLSFELIPTLLSSKRTCLLSCTRVLPTHLRRWPSDAFRAARKPTSSLPRRRPSPRQCPPAERTTHACDGVLQRR